MQKEYKSRDENLHIPEILGLKIILHFGYEIAPVQIGNRIKLLGEDVILAHRLLKNDIVFDEYILFSDALISHYRNRDIQSHLNWSELFTAKSNIDHLGEVGYDYIKLTQYTFWWILIDAIPVNQWTSTDLGSHLTELSKKTIPTPNILQSKLMAWIIWI